MSEELARAVPWRPNVASGKNKVARQLRIAKPVRIVSNNDYFLMIFNLWYPNDYYLSWDVISDRDKAIHML